MKLMQLVDDVREIANKEPKAAIVGIPKSVLYALCYAVEDIFKAVKDIKEERQSDVDPLDWDGVMGITSRILLKYDGEEILEQIIRRNG